MFKGENARHGNQPLIQETQETSLFRRPLWRFVIALIAVIFTLGIYVFMRARGQASRERTMEVQYEHAKTVMGAFEKTMQSDTYGGKIPEETMRLLIEALHKKDLVLASKYFSLGTSGSDYLNQNKWLEALQRVEAEKRLDAIVSLLSKAVPTKNQSRELKNIFWYSVYDTDGEVLQDIEFRLNEYSGVWKIESL